MHETIPAKAAGAAWPLERGGWMSLVNRHVIPLNPRRLSRRRGARVSRGVAAFEINPGCGPQFRNLTLYSVRRDLPPNEMRPWEPP